MTEAAIPMPELSDEKLTDEAFDLARLICPFPEEVDQGDEILRMPDDLLRSAVVMGELCRRLNARSALLRELRDALADFLSPYEGWNAEQLDRRADGATLDRIYQGRAALRKANEALGEKNG